MDQSIEELKGATADLTAPSLGLRVGDVFRTEGGTHREILGYDLDSVHISRSFMGADTRYSLSLAYVASALACGAWGVKQ